MPRTYCIIEATSNCGAHYECWQKITKRLEAEGWRKTKKVRSSGIILVKQCCMTTEELNEAMDSLVQLSKEKVQGRVFLGECLSRTKELVEVVKKKLANLKIFQFTTPEEFFSQLGEPYEEASVTPTILQDGSAIINISYGCNRKCTFCKVAYMDYKFQSVPMSEIVETVKMAQQQGVKRVVLNAMNSTEYNDQGKRLPDLLRTLLEIPDMLYQLNGIVLAELTDETIELLRNPRFVYLQMELQSFIPAVREKMGVGEMTKERILSIFKRLQGKMIASNVMTGYCRENDANFREQLEIIEQNNLHFLSVNFLVPTPGTKAASLHNPSTEKAKKRLVELTEVLLNLRLKFAEDMIGKEQTGIVYAACKRGEALVLCDKGAFVSVRGNNFEVGQRITVVPMSIKGLFVTEQQSLILSTEAKREGEMDEERAMKMMISISKMRMENEETCGRFNIMDMSLTKYCEGYITKLLKK